jgi:hypothetical protein
MNSINNVPSLHSCVYDYYDLHCPVQSSCRLKDIPTGNLCLYNALPLWNSNSVMNAARKEPKLACSRALHQLQTESKYLHTELEPFIHKLSLWVWVKRIYFKFYTFLGTSFERRSITVAAWSKVWTVFVRSNVGVMGLNPTQVMDVCVHLFCICVVLCVGSGLTTGSSLLQGVYRLCIGLRN